MTGGYMFMLKKDGMYRKKTHVGGFTLIELLVVVLIIGVLAAIALPQYNRVVARSKMAQVELAVNTLAKAQRGFWLENGEWAVCGSYADRWAKLGVTDFIAALEKKNIGYTGSSMTISGRCARGSFVVYPKPVETSAGLSLVLEDSGAMRTECLAPCDKSGAATDAMGPYLCESLGYTATGGASTCALYTSGRCCTYRK